MNLVKREITAGVCIGLGVNHLEKGIDLILVIKLINLGSLKLYVVDVCFLQVHESS